MRAIDFSSYRPTPDELVANGYRIVVRYVSRQRWKRIEIAEARGYLDAGLCIALVFEDDAMRPLNGYAAGAADAQVANDQADALGAPDEVAIFYAVDFDATPDQLAGPVRDYLNGVGDLDGARPHGVYGHYGTCEAFGAWIPAWQCAGWSGMGTGTGGSQACNDGTVRRRSRHAVMFQDVDGLPPWAPGATDLNHVYDTMPPTGLWCWPDPHHQLRKALTMRSVSTDLHPDYGIWLYAIDGWGTERRIHVDNPAAHVALSRIGVIDTNAAGDPDLVVLTGDEAAWFDSLPIGNSQWTADAGALALTMQTLAYIRERTEGLYLANGDPAGDGIETPREVALALAEFIAGAGATMDTVARPATPDDDDQPTMSVEVDTPDA